MAHRCSPATSLVLTMALILGAFGGCDSPAGPGDDDGEPDPGPGPHYSVVPIDLEKLARVTPLGTNGKVFPVGHTYWYTCDTEYLMPSTRPCIRERLPIRSPVDGVVWHIDHVPDGEITVRGPPGLYATLAHVTPMPGLARLDPVMAGDTIAIMYTDFAFDFGVTNYGIEHSFVDPGRFDSFPAYRRVQSPLEQYPEPIRSELLARVNTLSDPMGSVSFDVAGTAAGGWVREGTPFNDAFRPEFDDSLLFLGPLQERRDVRIVSKVGWFAAFMDMAAAALDGPKWEDIRPSTGPVWVPLWQALREDGGPDPDEPRGGVLLEVLEGEGMRIEWFDTHDEPADFTAAAELYER